METKKTYHGRKDELVKDFSAKIEDLRKKADRSKGEVKIIYYEQLDALRKNLDTARKRLTEFKGASEDKWEEFKDRVEEAIDELRKSVEDIKGKIKK